MVLISLKIVQFSIRKVGKVLSCTMQKICYNFMHTNCPYVKSPFIHCICTALHILHMYCNSYTASVLHSIYCKYTVALKCICSLICIFKKSVLIGCLFFKVYCTHTSLDILQVYCTSYTASILHTIYCKYTSALKCICSVICIFNFFFLIIALLFIH